MPAQLLALTDGPTIILEKPIILMGRHEECDVQLNSKKVSRRHCCVAQVNDYLIVRDLGSTNGVRINGQRVLEGRLKAGDELTVGNFRYQIFFDRADVPAVVAEPVKRRSPSTDDSVLERSEQPVPLKENSDPKRILRAQPAPIEAIGNDRLAKGELESSFQLPEKLRFPDPPR
jgi:pSer/pThr/pTyr-binding forkhead associated (FHA) protein